MSENTYHQTEVVLPEGYRFVDGGNMLPDEILALRKTTGWESEEDPDSKEGWLSYPDSALASVGVRNTETNELIGMGFIVGNTRHAVLADFNVHPNHQNQGIGTAILEERMRIADEVMKIPYLYTSLAETNPLAPKYKTLGFIATGNTYFRNNSGK